MPAHTAARVSGSEFSFVGETHRLAGDASRWHPGSASRLWTYNLHYFQFLHQLPRSDGLALVRDWVKANPTMKGTGWEPYPITMRIREWIEWLQDEPDPQALDELVASVGQQVEALRWQVEHHLQGNHLLENAISLCWAGLSLSGGRSEGWLRYGLPLLDRCLREQLHEDGSYEERSPMYQALLAESLLRLADVAQGSLMSVAARVRMLALDAGVRLFRALGPLVHPDGDYGSFQDTALGVAPTVDQLRARFPGLAGEMDADAPRCVSAGGYVAVDPRPGTRLIFDGGPIGPRHQPGHGHAGCLGFELSHNGQRLITDTGIGSYATGPERLADRSTAAHNTIQIDDWNQSEIWSAFRCGRRIQAAPVRHADNEDFVWVNGGYRGPARGVAHRRTFRVRPDRIDVWDHVTAPGEHRATLRLHLGTGVEVRDHEGGILLIHAGRTVAEVVSPYGSFGCERSPHHSTFGKLEQRACLRLTAPFRNGLRVRWAIGFKDHT